MSVPNSQRLRSQGFTLAEILIAIAIFALLVSIIMGSFSGVFSQTENLARQRINAAMARSCLMRMKTDLGSAYIEKPPFFKPPGNTGNASIYRFVVFEASSVTTPQVRLRFASRAHVDFGINGRQGIAVIRYYLEPMNDDMNPTFRLRRSDVLPHDEQLPELKGDPILCENIRTLQIEGLDAIGESFEEWDSSSADQNFATPRAVRIRLELASPTGPDIFQTIVALPLWRSASGKV